jgi:FKBP-type peptidyl-prolyl cis-trans isomerase (trigger factor)
MDLVTPPLVSTEKLGIIVRVEVMILPADVARAVDEAAKELRPKVTLSGFRKGKASLRLVRQKLKDDVLDSAGGKLRQAGIRHALDNISDPADRPFTQPEVETAALLPLKEGEPYRFVFSYQADPRALLQQIDAAGIPGAPALPGPGIPEAPFGPAATPAIEEKLPRPKKHDRG